MKILSILTLIMMSSLSHAQTVENCSDDAAEDCSVEQAPIKLPEVMTVDKVDITRYAGMWHQIAFFPNWFQGKCTLNTTATYTLRDDGKVSVHNECSKPNGKRKVIDGTAKVVDSKTMAKLKVKFFWFAPAGDYWIIDLGKNYEYALVGSPNRKYLWVLSRSPSLPKETYQALLDKAKAQGFDTSRLLYTGE